MTHSLNDQFDPDISIYNLCINIYVQISCNEHFYSYSYQQPCFIFKNKFQFQEDYLANQLELFTTQLTTKIIIQTYLLHKSILKN